MLAAATSNQRLYRLQQFLHTGECVCVCVYCKITWNHVQGGLKVVTDIILFILIHAHVPNFGQCYHAVTFSIAPLTTTTADIFLR